MKNFIKQNSHILIISVLNFVLVFASSFTPGYGYFIDEFYYIACADNPALGYVDHPPLAPLILLLYKFVLGESLLVIRLLPVIASSVTVFLSGIIAKLLGGKKTAQSVSAFAVFVSPMFLILSGFYSMNVFETLLAAVGVIFILKMINENNPKYWLHTSVVFGMLIMNKHTSVLFIVSVILFLLISEKRKLLFSKYFLSGIAIIFLIFLPYLVWQIKYDLPTIEFYKNITSKNTPVPVIEYIKLQALAYNPLVLILAFAGAVYFLFNKNYRNYNFLAFIFLVMFFLFLLLKVGRVDRIIFAYLIIIPAGGILMENIVEKLKQKWLVYFLCTLAFIIMISVIPVLMPYLNYENSYRLTRLYGLNTEMEKGKTPKIHQMLADRIGWEEKADMVAKVYLSLSEEDRKNTIVAAEYYGIAAAVEFYGKKYGIKNVVCGHNNYYFWSKSRLKGDIVLQLTNKSSYKGLLNEYNSVDSTEVCFDNEYCPPEGRRQTVFICKEPKYPKEELLEHSRYYY